MTLREPEPNQGSKMLPGFAALLVGLALLGSCNKSDSDAPESQDQGASKAKTKAKVVPLDPSYLPTDLLAQLETLNLETQPPCSLGVDSLRPLLTSLADSRKSLAAATDKATAVALLSDASAALSTQSAGIAQLTETDELRRTRSELIASIGDLAESLQLSSIALSTDDKSAAANNLRRIQNGVQNTRSTIDDLIQQCALP